MNASYQHPHSTHLVLEEPVVYGTFWERFGAAFIDGLILILPSFLCEYLLPAGGPFINLAISWLYAALLESGEGQATVGKRAMGLKVTREDGGRLSFGQASGRHFGKWVSALILLIGYLMMLWSERRQTLHDQMAGSVVVKA